MFTIFQALAKERQLKAKLEMAKFLQETIEQLGTGGMKTAIRSPEDFTQFMNKVRSGAPVSNAEILWFARAFEDQFTLENLTPPQLTAMCTLLGTLNFYFALITIRTL